MCWNLKESTIQPGYYCLQKKLFSNPAYLFLVIKAE